MFIEQLYTKSLSAFAYYIESDGEAAVIDPMRDIDNYLMLAENRGAVIKYVFETHFHADFISGHIDLSILTGAKIIIGPGATPEYNFYAAYDGEEFNLGGISLKVLHTPGHTFESSCILLQDERQIPHSVFTGDTLFVGDVGRPELAGSSTKTKEILAGLLFESIHTKLLPLPNYVIIYPAHGAGSAGGKTISTEFYSTIGAQKKSNYALRTNDKSEFVKLMHESISPTPGYFYMDAAINRQGYELLSLILKRCITPLNSDKVRRLSVGGTALIVDTRSAEDFRANNIPGSIFIGLDGPFESTAGIILDPKMQLIILADAGMEQDAVIRLARVGYENVPGYLQGGIDSWMHSGYETTSIKSYSAEEFAENFRYNSCNVIDVRNADEWIPGFVAGAKLISLPELINNNHNLIPDKVCFVYCTKGYRSMVACSILQKRGFNNVFNVSGGMNKIRKTNISIRQLSSLTD